MPIFIHRNGQQSGPYEKHIIIDQLRNGQLSPDDMGIRQGEKDWQKLRVMFPDAAPVDLRLPQFRHRPCPAIVACWHGCCGAERFSTVDEAANAVRHREPLQRMLTRRHRRRVP